MHTEPEQGRMGVDSRPITAQWHGQLALPDCCYGQSSQQGQLSMLLAVIWGSVGKYPHPP